MHTLVLIVILTLTPILANAESEYIQQPLSERVLFGESGDGAYLLGFYNSEMNVVRFQVCGEEQSFGHTFSSVCRPLLNRELRYGDLEYYQAPLLKRLEALRDRIIKDVDSSWAKTLLGGTKKDSNVKAINGLLEVIRADGLRGFMLHRRPPRDLSPSFSSKAMLKEVLKEFSETMKEPPPATAGPASTRRSVN